MEMASSIIIDFRPFDRRRDLPSGVNGGVERLNSFRYGPSDLASPDQFWIFSLSCREENYPRSIYPGGYILDNGDSYPRLPSDDDQVVRLFCPDILVLVLLPMWIDYFNDCARARSLGIAAQIKIMGKPPLVFTGLWFGIYLGLPSEKYKIVSWKKKEFEDLEDLLVSFRLYFVIVKDSSCNSTVYYLLL
jgi:hypothetical protein